ncbi:MAG: GldG family protein [Verrucomicrobiota bacterium]
MKSPTSSTSRTIANVNVIISVVLALFILIAINYLGFRHYYRKDLSLNKYYDLSTKTVEILKNLKEPVKITTFFNNSEIQVQVEQLVLEYQFHGGDKVKVERVDPAKNLERAEELAKKFKFTGEENLVIFEYKDRSKYISEKDLAEFDMGNPMAGGAPRKVKSFKGEQQFTSAIQTLIEGKASKVYFTSGHGEKEILDNSPKGLSDIATRIKGSNIEVESLNLGLSGEIPKDADALVIPGPKAMFNPAEVQIVARFLQEKGKVILMQDPQTTSGLEPLLEQYGMKFQNDIIITKAMMMLGGGMTAVSNEAAAIAASYADHPASNFLKGYNFMIPGARSLQILENADPAIKSKVTSLVKTGADSWGESNLIDKRPTFDPATDAKGPLTAVALFDGGEVPGEGVNVVGTRLVAIGSSLFLVNGKIEGTGIDFMTNLLNWMTKKETVLGISPKVPQEYSINLSPMQLQSVTVVSLIVIPGVALLIGIVVWYRRRR